MNKTDLIADRFKQFVMPTYAPRMALVRGRGTKVWDADGKVYLDMAAGIAVMNVGYAHPTVVSAVQEQAAKLMHVSNLYYIENQTLLAERLSHIGLKGKCFFCNSGAEANEAQIKLARLWGHAEGRYEIITMRNSFHGRTLGAMAATGQSKVQKGFEPMPDGFAYADFNDVASVGAQVNERTVAVLVEAVQGEGGVVPATVEFMKGLRALCDEKNLLLLCDEVQCGMGRTGQWFAYQNFGIAPDCFSLAKSLGSGFPIGAIVSSPKLSNVFQPGKHASTFGGNPLACAAALATLDVIQTEGLLERAEEKGTLLREGMESFAEQFPHVKGVRGMGLMLGLVCDTPVKPLVDKLAEMGLLTIATAENVVRFLPPLTVKDEELEEVFDILADALADWHAELDGTPEEAAPAAAETPAAAGAAQA